MIEKIEIIFTNVTFAGTMPTINYYSCSKNSNTFIFLFSNKVLAWIHKILNRIANREGPDQTASSKAV